MKSEFVVDIISQKVLLEDINAIRKKQILELTASKHYDIKQRIITEHSKNKKTSLKTIKQFSKHKRCFVVLAALTVSSFFIVSYGYDFLVNSDSKSTPLQTKYLIQNLRGDTTETWVSWDITPNRILTFTIVGESRVSTEKINIIKDAILSEKSLHIDNSVFHKGLKGTSSIYYLGWKGAMEQASKNPTKLVVPDRFQYVSSSNGAADITINLTNMKNGDGYSGYIQSVVDNNQILKSTITIYDIEKLSADQIATIVRYEFGHAMGLAHSTATEDLMFPTIDTIYPYISSCDVDAIVSLYDGNNQSKVICDV